MTSAGWRPAKAFENIVNASQSPFTEVGQMCPACPHVSRQRADTAGMGHHGNARWLAWGYGPVIAILPGVRRSSVPVQRRTAQTPPRNGHRCRTATQYASAPLARRGPSGRFDQHDRLAPCRRWLHSRNFRASLKPSTKPAITGGVIIEEIAGKVGEIQVGFLPRGNDVTVTHPLSTARVRTAQAAGATRHTRPIGPLIT